MNGYDIKDHFFTEDKEKHYLNEQFVQSEAIFEASNLINNAMMEKGFSQKQLSEEIGVSAGYISRLLSGNENMSVKNIARVLYALGKKYIQSTEDTMSFSNIFSQETFPNIINFKNTEKDEKSEWIESDHNDHLDISVESLSGLKDAS
ncbi:MAG: helix-turn-helix transcriptional regulator [Spirochaetes bacterium]|nr:helix-turn-helix transcriptional regulator [Spirochaetota bacterium]